MTEERGCIEVMQWSMGQMSVGSSSSVGSTAGNCTGFVRGEGADIYREVGTMCALLDACGLRLSSAAVLKERLQQTITW